VGRAQRAAYIVFTLSCDEVGRAQRAAYIVYITQPSRVVCRMNRAVRSVQRTLCLLCPV
jgi:hypothetical protein